MAERNSGTLAGGVVLLAKEPGVTSFSALASVKHAMGTSKVGHTGTLDSFASGLLVVCVGPLTRLASRITEFDKTYEAAVLFGTQTDTLECTGTPVRTAPLPGPEALAAAVAAWTGTVRQRPPEFSAIHINGKRASDLARRGAAAEIPERQVTVHSADVRRLLLDDAGRVSAAHISFHVSKGTYIRSLARDIAASCGSAAHLAGLRRTAVGAFSLADAAGASRLEPFSLERELAAAAECSASPVASLPGGGVKRRAPSEAEERLQQEIREKCVCMTPSLAASCDFSALYVKPERERLFQNGGKLSASMFRAARGVAADGFSAVFSEDGRFAGLVRRLPDGGFRYCFVDASFVRRPD
ncbi:MAG: tRNA pseudouridine(55) synthase TruB [Treponemataceae bacterium]|nr:tRNA pseudouridine(55) synthase TruB [Treponemataceae bacterium]